MSQVYAHFIGVGGAGMSGLALVLHERGVSVTGSDLKESRYARALQEAGVPVAIGHDASNLGSPDVVVVSSAIPETNPELAAAHSRGIPVWQRAQMLAHLAESRVTIAVAGTHGKTSTSSMIATMLDSMGCAPSFLVGGEIDAFGTNARHGDGVHCVVEADESDGSFVHLAPRIAVVTNIEADHLDHYASVDEIREMFSRFLARVAGDGTIVVCADDDVALEVARASGRAIITYGFARTADVRCHVVGVEGSGSRFGVTTPEGDAEAVVSVPGDHMVCNATAALACAIALDLDLSHAARALGTFSGVRRRFDLIGEVAGVTVVDDYAHHPTEIAATLEAASRMGFSRMWALFQPHRYSRTHAFAREFGDSLACADRVVLTDVYSAGEPPIPGVSGKTLVRTTLDASPHTRVAYLPHRADIVPFITERVSAGDLVLTMGAGDVTGLAPEIIAALEEREA